MRDASNLKDYSVDELRRRFASQGIEPYRADQVCAWMYRRGVDDPRAMTDLGRALRARLAEEWESRALEVERVTRSADGTRKGLLRARDGALLEAVLIPEAERTTLCVSTQVGCPLACSFCATGAMGLTRNLSPAEIVDQLCLMRAQLGEGREITNVVFMGMGEPLLNLDAVRVAIRLFVDPKGFGLAPRRITVSTVGVVPRLETLLACAPVNLAVSLHATTDELRDRLVPLNRRYPLASLLGALRKSRFVTPRRPVFFEYTLMAGVNDGEQDARRLPGLLHGIPSKVNLIPLNAHPDSPLAAPAEDVMDRFMRVLAGAGMRVTLRRSRGADIAAACGQLAGGQGMR